MSWKRRKSIKTSKKHHFQTFQKYQLEIIIQYFKMTKEKYFHVVIIIRDNVDWVILMNLKSPNLILNAPSNIVRFVCGGHQNLFLDSEGNVFSVGDNNYGSLGLGHNTNQSVLNKIVDIPPIQTISCVSLSSYLIDYEENLWTFGLNSFGQLGHGDIIHKNAPKIVTTLKDVKQISYGCSGYHFIAKNFQNQIFISGINSYGQLGTGNRKSVLIPKEINSQYSTIWGDDSYIRAKSARK